MAKKNFSVGLAKAIYDAYPHSDLLPIDPPTAKTTMEYFVDECECCGDTLFEFIVGELLEGGTGEDGKMNVEACLRVTKNAIKDLEAIHTRLLELARKGK